MLTWGRRPISLMLVMLILCALVILVNPQNSMASTVDPQIVGEIIELREANAKVYQLENGQFRFDIYPINIHYRDNDGKLKDIDNSIKEVSIKEGYRYSNTANSWYAFFKNSINQEKAIRIEDDIYAIEFSLLNSKDSIIEKSNTYGSSNSDFERTIAGDNRAVVYKNVFDNVDIAYTVRTFGLKEDIILRDNKVNTEFEFNINLENLELAQIGEKVLFINEKGNEVFEMAPLFMEDANGKISHDVTYSIKKVDEAYRLIISADKEFLNSSETRFPVVLDPTFNTSGSSYTSDTYIADLNSTIKETNYYTNDYLRTGKDTTYGVRRTYIRFKLPSGYNASGISAAVLKLKLYSKGSGSNTIKAYPSLGYWRSNQIVWDTAINNYYRNNASYSSTGYSATVSDNWYSMNVLTPISNCYNQNNSNFGFVIKDTVENNTSIWGTFYSSDSSNSSYFPVLSITYNTISSTYNYYTGYWPSNYASNMTGYSQDTGTEAANAFYNWDGIDSNLVFGSLSFSDPTNKRIRIYNNTTTIPSNYYAQTLNYDANGTGTWTGVWSYSIIELNKRSDSIYTPLHRDLREEIITHEIGHALGLKHYYKATNPTTCIMQQYHRYCYSAPTSHDRQNIQHKY